MIPRGLRKAPKYLGIAHKGLGTARKYLGAAHKSLGMIRKGLGTIHKGLRAVYKYLGIVPGNKGRQDRSKKKDYIPRPDGEFEGWPANGTVYVELKTLTGQVSGRKAHQGPPGGCVLVPGLWSFPGGRGGKGNNSPPQRNFMGDINKLLYGHKVTIKYEKQIGERGKGRWF